MDANAAAPGDQRTLIFEPSNWSRLQTVTVTVPSQGDRLVERRRTTTT